MLYHNTFSEWEDIPKEITNPDLEGGWETTKSRKSRSKIQSYTPQDLSRDQSSEIHIIPEDEEVIMVVSKDPTEVIPEVTKKSSSAAMMEEIAAAAAGTNDVDDANLASQSISQDENCVNVEAAELETVLEVSESNQTTSAASSAEAIELNSAPASRKSTLKRSKKKRSSLDGSGSSSNNPVTSSSTVLSRPVLISDGDYDVASAAAALRVQKNAFDVLDQDKLQELKKKSGGAASMDTLYVSDIGYGMLSGPIGLGRFGLGKYIPPSK